MIIADPAMTRLYALVARLAPADIPVLISGETGCGKELVAIAVHERSRRGARQLVSVNCAALHDALVESELRDELYRDGATDVGDRLGREVAEAPRAPARGP